jgi:hypothetical protein
VGDRSTVANFFFSNNLAQIIHLGLKHVPEKPQSQIGAGCGVARKTGSMLPIRAKIEQVHFLSLGARKSRSCHFMYFNSPNYAARFVVMLRPEKMNLTPNFYFRNYLNEKVFLKNPESSIWIVGLRPKIELQWPKIQIPNPNFRRTQVFFSFWPNEIFCCATAHIARYRATLNRTSTKAEPVKKKIPVFLKILKMY